MRPMWLRATGLFGIGGWVDYIMLTDTHAHLDYPEFQADFPSVLARAGAVGVKRMISIGTGLDSSRAAIALAENSAPAGVS